MLSASRIDPPELAPGLRVANRYRLDRAIGQGGMGSVWAARHMVTERAVALKFLKQSGESGESRLRFLREARAACGVVHPNVVTVLDFLEPDDGAPVMVLELLEGESLASLLARTGRLSVAETADIMASVVSAVGTAHAEGVVHRDLKPDNIFLHRERDGSRVVKVLDFGIAKLTVLDEDTLKSAGLTHTGDILGTPTYMSPEQVFGETDLDHRADIWALGIILYRCLSGVVPTDGSNIGQTFKIIVAGKIRPLSAVSPNTPEPLTRLVDSMLSRERDARPDDLRPVLDELLRHTTREVRRFGAPRGGRDSSPEAPTAREESDTLALEGETSHEPDIGANRSSRARWLVALAAVSALGVASVLALRGRGAPTLAPEVAEAPNAPPAPAPARSTAPSSSTPAPALSAAPAPPVALPREGASPASRPRPRVERASRSPRVDATHPEDPYGF